MQNSDIPAKSAYLLTGHKCPLIDGKVSKQKYSVSQFIFKIACNNFQQTSREPKGQSHVLGGQIHLFCN